MREGCPTIPFFPLSHAVTESVYLPMRDHPLITNQNDVISSPPLQTMMRLTHSLSFLAMICPFDCVCVYVWESVFSPHLHSTSIDLPLLCECLCEWEKLITHDLAGKEHNVGVTHIVSASSWGQESYVAHKRPKLASWGHKLISCVFLSWALTHRKKSCQWMSINWLFLTWNRPSNTAQQEVRVSNINWWWLMACLWSLARSEWERGCGIMPLH